MGRSWTSPPGSDWSYARDRSRGYRRSPYYGIEEWAPLAEFAAWEPTDAEPVPRGGWRQ